MGWEDQAEREKKGKIDRPNSQAGSYCITILRLGQILMAAMTGDNYIKAVGKLEGDGVAHVSFWSTCYEFERGWRSG
jgi:hypothetical protein